MEIIWELFHLYMIILYHIQKILIKFQILDIM